MNGSALAGLSSLFGGQSTGGLSYSDEWDKVRQRQEDGERRGGYLGLTMEGAQWWSKTARCVRWDALQDQDKDSRPFIRRADARLPRSLFGAQHPSVYPTSAKAGRDERTSRGVP